MSVLGITQIEQKSVSFQSYSQNTKLRFATGNSSDKASFSPHALESLYTAKNDTFTQNLIQTTANDGSAVNVNFYKSSLSYGDTTFNLKNFANISKDDIAVEKKNDGSFRVINMTTRKELLFDKSGQPATTKNDKDKDILDSKDFKDSLKTINNALVINNKLSVIETGASNDIIINRAAHVSIFAGAGADKIFNLNSTASRIELDDTTGSSSNTDALYTVGLRNTQVNAENTNAYIKSTGNITGASVLLGGGTNFLDASGRSILNSRISSSNTGSDTQAILASTLENSKLDLKGSSVAVDIQREIVSSQLNFGAGKNSLITQTIKGMSNTINAQSGNNSFDLGAVNNLALTGSAQQDLIKIRSAYQSKFNLGNGNNTLDAGKGNIKDSDITAGNNSTNNIRAGSFISNAGKNTIDLGKGNNNNTLNFSGTIQNATIFLGNGDAQVDARNISKSSISSDNTYSSTVGGSRSINVKGNVNELNLIGGTAKQNLSVFGKVNKLNYTGGNDDDTLKIGGDITQSKLSLGNGNNTLDATKSKISDTDITAGKASSNTIKAAAFLGAESINKIDFGDGNGNHTIELSGTLKNARVMLGNANANMAARNVLNTLIASDESLSTTHAGTRTLQVENKVAELNFIGSQASNKLQIGGTLHKSNITLGNASNNVSVGNVNNTKIEVDPNTFQKQSLTVQKSSSKLTYNGGKGEDSLSLGGNINLSQFTLGDGNNTLDANNADISRSNIVAGDNSSNTVKANAFKGLEGKSKIDLGNGNGVQTLDFTGTVKNATIYLGNGDAVLNTNNLTKSNISSNPALSVSNGGTRNITVKGNISEVGYHGTALKQNITVLGTSKKLTYTGGNGEDTLNFSGNIHASRIDLGAGNNSLKAVKDGIGQNLANVTINATSNSSNTIEIGNFVSRNNISSSMILGDNNSNVSIGKITGNDIILDLGKGANNFTAREIAGSAKSRIQLRAGVNGYSNQHITVLNDSSFLSYIGSSGADTLSFGNHLRSSTINLGEGMNALTVKSADDTYKDIKNTTIIASGANSKTDIKARSFLATNNTSKPSIHLGDGGNNLLFTGDILGSGININLGLGANTLEAQSIRGKQNSSVIVTAGSALSTNEQKITLHNSSSYLNYEGSAGKDSMLIEGILKNANIDLGNGNNTLSAKKDDVDKKMINVNISALGDVSSTTINAYSLERTPKGKSSISLGDGTNEINIIHKIDADSLTFGSGTTKISADIIGNKNAPINIKSAGALNLNLDELRGANIENIGTSTFNISIAHTIDNSKISGGASGALTLSAEKLQSSHITLGSGVNSLSFGTVAGTTRKTTIIDTHAQSNGAGATELTVLNNTNYLNLNISSSNANKVTLNTVENSNLNLGSGSNIFTAESIGYTKNSTQSTGKVNISLGNALGGAGNTSKITVNGNISNLSFTGNAGNDQMYLRNTILNSTLSLGAGDNVLAGSTTYGTATGKIINSQISASDGRNIMTIGSMYAESGKFSSLSVTGTGSANLTAKGTVGGTISLQTENNTAIFNEEVKGTVNFGSRTAPSRNDVTFNADLNKATVNIKGNDSINTVNVNKAVNNSSINMNSGSNMNNTFNATSHEASIKNSYINIGSTTATNANTLNLGSDIKGSAITLGSGITTVNANNGINSGIGTREKTSVHFAGNAESKGEFKLGSITSNVDFNLGKGSTSLTGSSASLIGTNITNNGAGTVSLGSLENAFVHLQGENSLITAGEFINSTINLAGDHSTIGSDTSNYTKTNVTVASKSTINGNLFNSSALTLNGNDNEVNLENSFVNSNLNLNGSNTTLGSTNTVFENLNLVINGDSTTIRGDKILGGNIKLGNGSNKIDVKSLISDIDLTLGGTNNTIGVSGQTNITNMNLNVSGSGTTILGNSLTGGTINLGSGNANIESNTINNAKINITGGSSTIGTDTSNISHTSISITQGSNTIKGNSINGGTINITGNTNTIGGTNTNFTNANINISGDKTLMQGNSLSGGTINLNSGSNKVYISGNVANAKMNLGGSNNEIGSGNTTNYNNLNLQVSGSDTKIAGDSIIGGTLNLYSGNNTISMNTKIAGANINASGGKNTVNTALLSGGTMQLSSGDNKFSLGTTTNATIKVSGGNNTFAATTISGGTIQLASGNNKLDVTGTYSNATLNISGNGNDIKANAFNNATLNLSGGSNIVSGTSVSGGTLNFTGTAGNNKLSVTDINGNTKVNMSGNNNILTATNALIGLILNTKGDNTKVSAQTASGGSMSLSGNSNTIAISGKISNATISSSGTSNKIGTANTVYENVNITSNTANNVITGKSFSGGTITLGSAANLELENLASNVTLTGAGNTVGKGNTTTITGGTITANGDTQINVSSISGSAINLGGTANHTISSTNISDNTTINLSNTGKNNIQSDNITNSSIKSSGSNINHNTINTKTLNGSTITLGNGDDKVTVVTSDSGSSISLGGGTNNAKLNTSTDATIVAGAGTDTVEVSNLNNGTINVNGAGTTKVYAENQSGGTINFSGTTNTDNLISVGNAAGTINLGANMSAGVNNVNNNGIININTNTKTSVGNVNSGGQINITTNLNTLAINNSALGSTVNLTDPSYSNSIAIGTITGTITGATIAETTGTPAGNTSGFGKK